MLARVPLPVDWSALSDTTLALIVALTLAQALLQNARNNARNRKGNDDE